MSAVTRLGDVCSGHDCYEPRVCIEASTNVFINGLGVTRAGDKWETHCCGPSCHDTVGLVGSSKVFVNGRAVMRIGDELECGSVSAQGSPNTFFG